MSVAKIEISGVRLVFSPASTANWLSSVRKPRKPPKAMPPTLQCSARTNNAFTRSQRAIRGKIHATSRQLRWKC